MKNSLRINSESIPEAGLSEIIIALDSACRETSIDFFMIGARAKDFWFKSFKLPVQRFTRDVDFAVVIADLQDFERLLQILQNHYGFKVLESIPHRVIWLKNDFIINLIPFGEIENAGYVHFKDKFDTVISVNGLKEVYQQTIELLIDDYPIKLASLPGLCMLKLISWSDKPEERSKDILDIFHIIENYFEIESEQIYQDHPDVFESENFTMLKAGARVLGREISLLSSRSDKLKIQLIRILSESLGEKEEPGKVIRILTGTSDYDQDTLYELFHELLKGITEY